MKPWLSQSTTLAIQTCLCLRLARSFPAQSLFEVMTSRPILDFVEPVENDLKDLWFLKGILD